LRDENVTQYKRILRWQLDEGGGGTAWLFEYESVVAGEVSQFVFDSLDTLPSDLAAAIREDGQQSGELTLP
jgi:hypothetical protein